MFVNMLSLERSKGFQYKYNCLESLTTKRVRKTRRVQKTARVWKTTRSIENHKNMKSPRDQETRKSVKKSTRVKEACQVSRTQNPKNLEDWQIIRVRNQENNS
jgi:hypothetical protein